MGEKVAYLEISRACYLEGILQGEAVTNVEPGMFMVLRQISCWKTLFATLARSASRILCRLWLQAFYSQIPIQIYTSNFGCIDGARRAQPWYTVGLVDELLIYS